MREILFRGKCKNNYEWIIGTAFPHDNINCTMFYQNPLDGSLEGKEVDPETVGQYIGKRDKNGTKIFEGDILGRNDGRNFQVRWSPFFTKFEMRPIEDGTQVSKVVWGNCEIIGNIYDNPELMDEK